MRTIRGPAPSATPARRPRHRSQAGCGWSGFDQRQSPADHWLSDCLLRSAWLWSAAGRRVGSEHGHPEVPADLDAQRA